jgi:thiol-disulfide isomerase/thioredoxin
MRIAACLWLLAAFLVGCGSRPAASKEPAVDVDVKIGSAAELEKLIASHKGNVVLVDFWATWCSPCVANFPHVVKLSKEHREGFSAIAVSLDDPDDLERVKEFLAAQGAGFEHLLSKDGGSSASMEAFDLDASVPHYRLYDRAGKLVQEWGVDLDGMDAAIAAELAKR